MIIFCNDVNVEDKSSAKYLGITFEQDMTCSSMGKTVFKIVNAKLKFLYRKCACCALHYYTHTLIMLAMRDAGV